MKISNFLRIFPRDEIHLDITFIGTCDFSGTDKQYLNSTFEE
jgi:hypothetical protein